MPRISDPLLRTVVYLYETQDAAIKNDSTKGATGFFLSLPSTNGKFIHLYLVTCRHVVRRPSMGDLWISLLDDTAVCIPKDNWILHPDEDDVAVLPMARMRWKLDPARIRPIGYDSLITREISIQFSIGIGDDVFWTGKLLKPDGNLSLQPILRTGHISAIPQKIIQSTTGLRLESFLVESFSITGSSGSPVFVHIPELTNRPQYTNYSFVGPWLLGVDFGHLTRPVEIEAHDKADPSKKFTLVYQSNSGIMQVAPAWKIHDIVFSEEQKLERLRLEHLVQEQVDKHGTDELD